MEAEHDSDYCFWHDRRSGKDLSSKKIKEKNLVEAYLVMANLANSEFEECTDLSFANLREANLWATNLKEANLTGANLQRAKLWMANLQRANLTGANFESTSSVYRTRHRFFLSLGNFLGQELHTANFQEVHSYGGTLFRKSILLRANFQAANLKGADFNESNLESANFTGSYLAGANLKEANLTGTNLKGAFLYTSILYGAKNLQYAYLSRAIEEIIGDVILKLGELKEEKAEVYRQKFSNEISRSLQLNKEKDSKIIVDSIMNYCELKSINNLNLVFETAGSFYVKAKDVYLNLKNYFRDNGLYDSSGSFYILEKITDGKIQKVSFRLPLFLIIVRLKFVFSKRFRLIVKEGKKQIEENGKAVARYDLKIYPYTRHIESVGLAQDVKSFFQNLLSWIGNTILNVTSLYGESPLRVFLTALWAISIYALIYVAFGGVLISSNSHIAKSILDYIYFSIGTFVTISYGEFTPTPSMRLVAGSEAFLGAFIIAYFVVVVSRKIMR